MLELAASHGLAGLNVTHPLKQSIVPHLDELSTEAAAIGAVNTIVFTDGKAIGHNTDCWGFAASFRSAMQDAGLDRVLLIGAGGAGKAVARALCRPRCQTHRYLRPRSGAVDEPRREPEFERRRRIDAAAARDVAEAATVPTGLVNTTPVGMAKYPGNAGAAPARCRPDLWVADIIYFPAETALLGAAAAAAAARCRARHGHFPGREGFELITGRQPGPEARCSRHFVSATAHESRFARRLT